MTFFSLPEPDHQKSILGFIQAKHVQFPRRLGSVLKLLEMKSCPEDESLGDDIVLEHLVSASGLIVHTQDPVAEPERGAFADVDTNGRKQLPGEIRAGAESTDVSLHREMPFASEALLQLQADDRIDPLRGLIEVARKNRSQEVELALKDVPARPSVRM
jgi:hypothetical protein